MNLICYNKHAPNVSIVVLISNKNQNLGMKCFIGHKLQFFGLLQGFANALKLVKEMKDMEAELNEKLAFLGSFVTSFRHQIHTDIQIKPGNNGPSIPAHRALLVSGITLSLRSIITLGILPL